MAVQGQGGLVVPLLASPPHRQHFRPLTWNVLVRSAPSAPACSAPPACVVTPAALSTGSCESTTYDRTPVRTTAADRGEHGTLAGSERVGAPPVVVARREYDSVRRAAEVLRRGGEPASKRPPSTRVRRHLEELRRQGWGVDQIADAAGVHRCTVQRILQPAWPACEDRITASAPAAGRRGREGLARHRRLSGPPELVVVQPPAAASRRRWRRPCAPTCPVRSQCLATALVEEAHEPAPTGIRGGLNPQQRRLLLVSREPHPGHRSEGPLDEGTGHDVVPLDRVHGQPHARVEDDEVDDVEVGARDLQVDLSEPVLVRVEQQARRALISTACRSSPSTRRSRVAATVSSTTNIMSGSYSSRPARWGVPVGDRGLEEDAAPGGRRRHVDGRLGQRFAAITSSSVRYGWAPTSAPASLRVEPAVPQPQPLSVVGGPGDGRPVHRAAERGRKSGE